MIKSLIQPLKEIIYPRHCLLCREKIQFNKRNSLVCPECLKGIPPHLPPFCQRCGRGLAKDDTAGHICEECQNTDFYFERAWAACRYKDNARELIHQFKYKNKASLANPLAGIMIDFIRQYHLPLNHCDCLIPIPLAPSKLREREFNQAQALAGIISGHLGIKLLSNSLKRIRNTPAQANLDTQSRWKNIAGAFAITSPGTVEGKTILLIDDILTTGATVSEAAKALKNAKANSVYVLTLAS